MSTSPFLRVKDLVWERASVVVVAGGVAAVVLEENCKDTCTGMCGDGIDCCCCEASDVKAV